jgi:hypothetical protein
MGVHCAGRVLLKKADRKGFRGCIHSTFARHIDDYTDYTAGVGPAMRMPKSKDSRIDLPVCST